MKARQIAIAGLAACVGALAAHGAPTAEPPQAAAPVDNANLVTVKLLETSDLVVPGEEAVLLLQATIAKGWHTYWAGPSNTGFPLNPKWSLPEGWILVRTEWPVPTRHTSPGDILDHVYEGQATLVVTLKVPPTAAAGQRARIAVDVAWLACQEACIPGHAKKEIELKVAPPGTKPTVVNIDALMSARAALAVPLLPGNPVASGKLEDQDTGWVYRIQAGRAARIRFFPGPDCAAIPNLIQEGDVAGTESVLALDAKKGRAPRVQGIVQIVYPSDEKSGKPGMVTSFSIDTAEKRPVEPSAASDAAKPNR